MFYQMSYDGTYVPIIADYPGLLPASHVSDPKTPYSKEISPSFLPTAPSCAPKGKGSTHRTTPRVPPKSAYPMPGEPSKSKANKDTVVPSSKRYEFANPPLRSHVQPSTSRFPFARRSEQLHFPQPGFKSCCEDGG